MWRVKCEDPILRIDVTTHQILFQHALSASGRIPLAFMVVRCPTNQAKEAVCFLVKGCFKGSFSVLKNFSTKGFSFAPADYILRAHQQ